MKTLFVMDPLERLHVAGDSTYMMMLEARRRGWPVAFCTPRDLYAVGGRARGRVQDVDVTEEAPHFFPSPVREADLGEFDVIWMRKDPPFDMHYIFTTYLLDLVPPTTTVLNDPASIRSANEKMFAQQWPELSPPTLVTADVKAAMSFIRESGWPQVVLKPWDGNGGRGVLVSHPRDPNLRSMLEVLTGEGRDYILVQRYIPEIKTGDKRIILIDGEPVGWMLRVPGEDDHRGNMHVGATVVACELSEADRRACDAIAPALKEMGLLFVGIDMIGEYLTEINVTSPTGIQEINRLMGLRLEQTLTDAVLRHVQQRNAT
ncbi:MAG: glutathione synthase [Myxococcota bacterium]